MFPRTLVFMLVCAGIGYFLGRTRGMGLQGLLFGLAFGPLGWALTLLWPRSWVQGPLPRQGGGAPPETQREGAGERDEGDFRAGCPRCRRAVDRDAGSCPHCGNVLVPIRYAVENGQPPAP